MDEKEARELMERAHERAELLYLYLSQPGRDRSAVKADAAILALAEQRYACDFNNTLLLQPEEFTDFIELIYYIGYLRGLETGKLEAAYPEK